MKEYASLIGSLFAMKEDHTYNVGWNFNAKLEGNGFDGESVVGCWIIYLTLKKLTELTVR